jgi:hypothetical protein
VDQYICFSNTWYEQLHLLSVMKRKSGLFRHIPHYHNRYTNANFVIKYLTVDISTDCWNLFQIEYTIFLSLPEHIQHILFLMDHND